MTTDISEVAVGDWFVDILSSVRITVTDPTHILRYVENHTDEGVPAGPGERGIADVLYGPMTVEEVMQHLAFNCAVNDVQDASRLDGWGDLDPGQLTMSIERTVEYERVLKPS